MAARKIELAETDFAAAPVIEQFEGIDVARDDYFPGGTKGRYVDRLFEGCDEVAYATPAQGGAQVALAVGAKRTGKRATLFVAKSKVPSSATQLAEDLGARIEFVPMGFLSHVQKRADEYVKATPGSRLAPFGFAVPGAEEAIAEAARRLGTYDEVWCAAASGTLARGLALAFPSAARHAVRVGRAFTEEEVQGATPHESGRKYEQRGKVRAPFSANEHYESKAWEICRAQADRSNGRRVLFWNVTARPEDVLARGVEGGRIIGQPLAPGLGRAGDVAAVWVAIEWVKRWNRNPRINEKTVAGVARSIQRFGFGAPLVCRSDGTLIAGDTRIKAAHSIGLTTVPVRTMDHLSVKEAEALAIADNRLAEKSKWEPFKLDAVLAELGTDLSSLAGFDAASAARLSGITHPLPSDAPEVFSQKEIADAMFRDLRASGFPYRRLSISDCMREINALGKAENTMASTVGYGVADTYHPHRMHAAADGMKSPVESFENDVTLAYAIDVALNTGSSVQSVINIVKGTQACANFRPGFALRLYRRFTRPGDTILDTSTGYGGRLVGFLAAGGGRRYIGVDPNVPTHEGNLRLARDLGASDRVELLNMPAEDVPLERLRGRCDFSFTSPPYWRKELYSDDPTQSHVRFPGAEQWRDGFLVRMCALQFAALKPGCANVINIADVNVSGKRIPLARWARECALSVGFVFEAEEVFPVPARHAFGGGEHEEVTAAPVLIFRKPR